MRGKLEMQDERLGVRLTLRLSFAADLALRPLGRCPEPAKTVAANLRFVARVTGGKV